jgi:hypothetical protein
MQIYVNFIHKANIYWYIMKDFIQNKLRVLLEGRLATHTRVSPSGPIDNSDTTQSQFENALFKIQQAKSAYNDLTMEEQQQLGDVYTGDGLYEIQLSKNGDLRGKENRLISKAQVGTYNDPNPNKRYFYVAANRGISHPEYDDETRVGYTVGKSPMADAILKVRVFMGDDIISFLKNNMGYLDDKGAEIQAAKMSPDELERLAGKEGLYAKRAQQSKGFDDEEVELRNKLNDLKMARLKSKDQSEIKKIRGIEGQLMVQLKAIEKERNKRRSSNG